MLTTTRTSGPGLSSETPGGRATVRETRSPVVTPLAKLAHPIIVTIDGPAGTGKSSVARALARRLGLDFLDTGAMYRAAALVVLERGLPLSDPDAIVKAVAAADITFDWTRDPPGILAHGKPVESRIRDADVTAIVSPVAGVAALRRHLVAKQQIIADEHRRLVTEGRDQGSVVFPHALIKFYLDADPLVRAQRRAEQLRAEGKPVPPLATLHAEIVRRDESDKGRAVGPLSCPGDAHVVDTSTLSFDQVVDVLEAAVRARVAAAF